MNFFARVGSATLGFIRELGKVTLFLLETIRHSGEGARRFGLIVRQIYFFGVRSILIVAVSGFFIGMVMGLQGYTTLVQFKAADALGFAAAVGLLREIGPVLAALLFASSAGGAMTSEIGLMRSTGQLEAMDVMAVNPVSRIVAPRFWAGVISMPLLGSICNATAIYGTYVMGVGHFGLDSGIFWSQMQAGIDFRFDIVNGLIKSLVFGVAVSLVAVHNGYTAKRTPEGILRATTRTVVVSSLAVLALDFVMTAFMFA